MKIHFIGIGGIGVSALARYYLQKGHKVSGSDLVSSEITDSLEKIGAKIFIGEHRQENISQDLKKVIYTVAIKASNPELKKAQEIGIKIQTYPQALGELTQKYWTIAVCGAHGKGTTTAMVSLILINAGFDPSVIIGTNLKEFNNTNCRVGKSKYLVIEADEYGKAFLNYSPRIVIVTNIDREHLDYYHDLDDIISSFKQFSQRLPQTGTLILNADNHNVSILKKQILKSRFKIREYSIIQKESKKLKKILKIPGNHNVSNALGALALARTLKIPDKTSFSAISKYKGAWRRFETLQAHWGKKDITIISDYAHHPSEIKATLQGAREKYKKKKIWVIFQPHQYQRTYYLFNEFVHSFNDADKIILTDIYSVAGREKKEIIEKVSSKKLFKAIKKNGKNIYYIQDFKEIPEFIKKQAKSKDVIVVMGAGTIYKIVKQLI